MFRCRSFSKVPIATSTSTVFSSAVTDDELPIIAMYTRKLSTAHRRRTGVAYGFILQHYLHNILQKSTVNWWTIWTLLNYYVSAKPVTSFKNRRCVQWTLTFKLSRIEFLVILLLLDNELRKYLLQ